MVARFKSVYLRIPVTNSLPSWISDESPLQEIDNLVGLREDCVKAVGDQLNR